MRALFIIFVISLSLATLGEAKAADKKELKKSAKTKDVKAIEAKADCETTEEIKKKIEAKPASKALLVPANQPAAAAKSDGFSLQGASTGCSL